MSSVIITDIRQRSREHQARIWVRWLRERPAAIRDLLRQHHDPQQYIALMVEGGATEEEIREVIG